jgi:hypothetical protein
MIPRIPKIIVAEIDAVIPSILSSILIEFIRPITQNVVSAKSSAGISVKWIYTSDKNENKCASELSYKFD